MTAFHPDFTQMHEQAVFNFKTNERCWLRKATDFSATPATLSQIKTVCNEPLIYDLLFRRRLKGETYNDGMAASFLSWAVSGWEHHTHFVFLVTDGGGKIRASVDIKSGELEGAEIGYWASAQSSGIATPAVKAVCEIARKAGYKSLSALTLPENERSTAVLRRNDFKDLGLILVRDRSYLKFYRDLQNGTTGRSQSALPAQ